MKPAQVTQADLPEDWTAHLEVTRDQGTAWLTGGSTVLLRVPSALVPETWNYILNPAHPEAAKLRIAAEYPYPFDERLKQ
jgi:RES domain-containing protein